MIIGIIGTIIGVLVTIAGLYYLVTDGKKDAEAKKIYTVIMIIGILIFSGCAVYLFLR